MVEAKDEEKWCCCVNIEEVVLRDATRILSIDLIADDERVIVCDYCIFPMSLAVKIISIATS